MRRELKGHSFGSRSDATSFKSPKEGKTAPPANPPSSRSTGKKIYSSWKDALVGVNQVEIEEHKATKAGCWRCGRDGHHSTECYAKTTRRGTALPAGPGTAAAVGKRKCEELGMDVLDTPTSRKRDTSAAVIQCEGGREVPLWADDSGEDF
jgi:hypothetical protein